METGSKYQKLGNFITATNQDNSYYVFYDTYEIGCKKLFSCVLLNTDE